MFSTDDIQKISYVTSLDNDKILGQPIEDNFAIGASTRTTTSIPQNMGENILPVMQFSTDGNTWQEAGSVVYDSSGGSLFQATCYTDSTEVVIVAENYTGSPLTCYFRVVLVSDT